MESSRLEVSHDSSFIGRIIAGYSFVAIKARIEQRARQAS
jgi:hypothetical protein